MDNKCEECGKCGITFTDCTCRKTVIQYPIKFIDTEKPPVVTKELEKRTELAQRAYFNILVRQYHKYRKTMGGPMLVTGVTTADRIDACGDKDVVTTFTLESKADVGSSVE